MAGPFRKRGGGFFGGLLRARGDGDEVELHGGEIAAELVEADARELAGDAEALEVGVRAEVDIAAEHAGADEGDFDDGFHIDRKRESCAGRADDDAAQAGDGIRSVEGEVIGMHGCGSHDGSQLTKELMKPSDMPRAGWASGLPYFRVPRNTS
jgi:hypothetical protein